MKNLRDFCLTTHSITTYDKLLNEGYISEWIDKANQVNSNNPQLDAQCYVYKSEVQKIITIELKYL